MKGSSQVEVGESFQGEGTPQQELPEERGRSQQGWCWVSLESGESGVGDRLGPAPAEGWPGDISGTAFKLDFT